MTDESLQDFDPSARSGDRTGGSRTGLWFVLGLTLGIVATLTVPELAGPYLPDWLRGDDTRVEGSVVEKQREEDRLLLTIDTDRGAVLATFHRRVPELDLLVSPGDVVTLRMGEYRPFVEDPVLAGVWKERGKANRGSPPGSAVESPATAPGSEATGAGEAPDTAGRSGADTSARSRTDTASGS